MAPILHPSSFAIRKDPAINAFGVFVSVGLQYGWAGVVVTMCTAVLSSSLGGALCNCAEAWSVEAQRRIGRR